MEDGQEETWRPDRRVTYDHYNGEILYWPGGDQPPEQIATVEKNEQGWVKSVKWHKHDLFSKLHEIEPGMLSMDESQLSLKFFKAVKAAMNGHMARLDRPGPFVGGGGWPVEPVLDRNYENSSLWLMFTEIETAVTHQIEARTKREEGK